MTPDPERLFRRWRPSRTGRGVRICMCGHHRDAHEFSSDACLAPGCDCQLFEVP